jgi:signal transduction histidine kinase/CheY-like chemotaxis protein
MRIPLRDVSIKKKLLIIIMAASSVAVLLAAAGFITYEKFTFRQKMVRDLSSEADIIANRSTAALVFDNKEDAEENLNSLAANPRIVAACLFKGTTLFAQYPKGTDASSYPAPARPGARFEQDHLAVFREISHKGEKIGTLYLQSDLRELRQRLVDYSWMILVFMFESLTVTFLLSSALTRIITKPIFDLAQTAKKVSAGANYSLRAQRHGHDELGQLVDGFNEMLEQIQRREEALQEANDRLEKRVQERTRELEKAYNEIRQTQQNVMQQERLKALGQMASGIAHDINNALSPVIGFADLLSRAEPGITANGRKYLQHIKTSGEDIAHIVARLREFYRRRDQREPLLSVNLNNLAQQVIDMTRPRWRDIPQGLGLTVEVKTGFAPSLPDLIGIESELREGLTNLILNAVDALPQGGVIEVTTRAATPVAISGHNSLPTHIILEVSDNGTGMDEQTRKRCLEPFFSTKGRRGTGLGLAMVYGVMERHEGKIEIESKLACGTTMRLVFPIRKPPVEPEKPAETSAPPPGLQILCIDDEPLLRELLKETLESDGHTVQVSDSGQAGLEAFRAARGRGEPFDIVITDLGMPHLDGRQVAKALKSESPQTPIVLLTGWGTVIKEDGDMSAPVDGVLSKPPRARELRETLNRLISKANGSHS